MAKLATVLVVLIGYTACDWAVRTSIAAGSLLSLVFLALEIGTLVLLLWAHERAESLKRQARRRRENAAIARRIEMETRQAAWDRYMDGRFGEGGR